MPSTARKLEFRTREQRKLAVVSFRDTDDFDVRIGNMASALGLTKGYLLRSVVHQVVDAQESRQSRRIYEPRELQTRMLVARLHRLWK